MRILLIAGHGAGDPGACGNGYREADLTREVVGLLYDEIIRQGHECSIADTSINWFEYVKKNGFTLRGYDYLLEIHFNSGGGTGVEIFTPTARSAGAIEHSILANITDVTGYKNRGAKQKNFTVIASAHSKGIKSALLEVCFIDNANDVNIYQAKKARIISAIAASFGKSKKEELTMGQYEELKARLDELEAKCAAAGTENERQNIVIEAVGEDIQTLFDGLRSVTGENYRQNDIIDMIGQDIAALQNS